MTTMIEKMARAMADARFRARLEEIRKSQRTSRPISYPGPFDGMDYLLSEEAWVAAPKHLKEPYLRDARAALTALLEPSEAMVEAGAALIPDESSLYYEQVYREMALGIFAAAIQAALDEKEGV